MSALLNGSAEVKAWCEKSQASLSALNVYARIATSVVWSDARGPDGELLVPIDPVSYSAELNANPSRLLYGHDPGFPLGKVLETAVFTNQDGTVFIAAILGFYGAKTCLSFRSLGLYPGPTVASPTELPAVADAYAITLGTDPREVDQAWLEDVLQNAEVEVDKAELSHNAAQSHQELMVFGVAFVALVFKPFVTAVASEAGKKAYVGIHQVLLRLLSRLDELKNPAFEIKSHHNGSHLSFMVRGKNVKRHRLAYDALPAAAAQAQHLIANMKNAGLAPQHIVYEFDSEGELWFPSSAELHDGRLVTDNKALLAAEQLPSGLSLGMVRKKSPIELSNG